MNRCPSVGHALLIACSPTANPTSSEILWTIVQKSGLSGGLDCKAMCRIVPFSFLGDNCNQKRPADTGLFTLNSTLVGVAEARRAAPLLN